jgi:2-desacetyl-2-hydroxyethyl bacteriochlorophyllide A dehydrogenase
MMKVMRIEAPKDVRYIEVDKPKVGPEDVLVRVRYCGLCGTDLAIYSGDMSFVRDGLIKYPVRIGHEWSGIVAEVGSAVTDFRPGDRVIGDNWVSCQRCPTCLAGDFRHCTDIRAVGTVNCWDGGFAEFVLMPERHLYHLPDCISLEDGALLEPLSIAFSGVKASGLRKGSSVLVIGTGTIGLAAVMLAKHLGAGTVMLAGRNDGKLAIGEKMGADVLLNLKRQDLPMSVREATNGLGADIVLETSGAIEHVRNCPSYLAQKGTAVLIGFYETTLEGFPIDTLVLNQLRMIGSTGESSLHELIELVSKDDLTMAPVITSRILFDEAADAIRNADASHDRRIKTLVEVTK